MTNSAEEAVVTEMKATFNASLFRECHYYIISRLRRRWGLVLLFCYWTAALIKRTRETLRSQMVFRLYMKDTGYISR